MEGMLIVAAVSYLFYDSMWAVIALCPYVYFYVREKQKEMLCQERRVMTSQFKDAIISVSFALSVGYSIENAFREATAQMAGLYGADSRIVLEFKGIVRRINNNECVEDVLCEFAERSQAEDILHFAEVFKYARRSGGDMIAIIKSTAEAIRQKQEVESDIQTVISGKKMEQRVMSIMPLGMIVYLKVTSPDMMSALYGNIVGVAVMTVCLMIYAASVYMAKKIVDIEV